MPGSSTRNSFVTLAALALSCSIMFSQQPAAQPAPPSSSNPAPVERRPPLDPGMRPGGSHHGGHFRAGERGPMDMGDIGPHGMWWKNPAIVERLSLTADQTKKMDEIVEQSRLQLIDLRANLEKQQVMLEPMLSANPLDAAKASLQIDKVANARADLEKADAKMLLNIRGVLTPDQWTKLHERHFGAPDAQDSPAPAGGSGAASGSGGGGRWRGPRPVGNGGNAMDNLVAPID